MISTSFQIAGIIHGSLGAALLAILLLSVWIDTRSDESAFGSGLQIAALLQLAQAVLGLVLHVEYNAHLRTSVFMHSEQLGWWVERKEHIAVGAVVLTWSALAAYAVSRRVDDAQLQSTWRRAASIGARAAAGGSFLVFLVGVIVAAAMPQ